jgi:hypothetical protein
MSEEERGTEMHQVCRDHVRESFFFKVKFQRLCMTEYQMKKAEWAERLSLERKSLHFDDLDADYQREVRACDSVLLGFFLEMDEKLDQIIAHLSGRSKQEEFSEEGVGIDLSGGGMRIGVAKPLDMGQLVCAKLFLSRLPLVRVHLFGEVVYVQARMHGEGACYKVGVRFLDLDAEDRERIIACVFQRQREVLRKMKGKDETDEEAIQSIE